VAGKRRGWNRTKDPPVSLNQPAPRRSKIVDILSALTGRVTNWERDPSEAPEFDRRSRLTGEGRTRRNHRNLNRRSSHEQAFVGNTENESEVVSTGTLHVTWEFVCGN
jgi:hypothetical protein